MPVGQGIRTGRDPAKAFSGDNTVRYSWVSPAQLPGPKLFFGYLTPRDFTVRRASLPVSAWVGLSTAYRPVPWPSLVAPLSATSLWRERYLRIPWLVSAFFARQHARMLVPVSSHARWCLSPRTHAGACLPTRTLVPVSPRAGACFPHGAVYAKPESGATSMAENWLELEALGPQTVSSPGPHTASLTARLQPDNL